jgi:predicted deacetylase
MIDPHDAGFWSEMRELESEGACVGVHGLTHLNDQQGCSLIPLHRETEFAGSTVSAQLEKIEQGIQILKAQGLTPRIWIAPRHGFDRNTLRALMLAGLDLLSDGLAKKPFRQGGVVWIPQQIWEPVSKRAGLWTICIHANTCTQAQFTALEEFVRVHHEQFTGVDVALKEFAPTPLNAIESAIAWLRLTKIRISKWRKRQHGRRFISPETH